MLMAERILIEGIFALLMGAIIFSIVLRRCETYWPALIFTSIVAGGLVQGAGYVLFDEIALYAANAAMVYAFLKGRHAIHWQRLKSGIFQVVLALCALLLGNALRTMVLASDWHMVRWALLYANVLIFLVITAAADLEKPDAEKTAWLVVVASSVYFGLYILHWVVIDVILKMHWEALQAITWAGSSYALFICVLSLPAALIVLRSSRFPLQACLVYSLISGIAFATIIYGSRAALIAILLAGFIGLAVLRFRQAGVLWGVILVSMVSGQLAAPTPTYKATGAEYLEMLSDSILMPISPRVSDTDRRDHLKAAVGVLKRAPLGDFLFGAGEDQHKKLLVDAPELKKYQHGLHPQVVRSSAAVAFLINQGAIGAMLLAVIFVGGVQRLWSRPHWKIALPFFLLTIAWSMITDYRDQVLVYVLLLPAFFKPNWVLAQQEGSSRAVEA